MIRSTARALLVAGLLFVLAAVAHAQTLTPIICADEDGRLVVCPAPTPTATLPTSPIGTPTATLEPEFPTPEPSSTPAPEFPIYRWEAEDFTSAANTGPRRNPASPPPYRPGETVTIQPGAMASNGWYIGFVDAGEEWRYTGYPHPVVAGQFRVRMAVAQGVAGRPAAVEIYATCPGDLEPLYLGIVRWEDVRGWQTFYVVEATLTAPYRFDCFDGVTLRSASAGAFNIDWLEVQPVADGIPTRTPTPTWTAVPVDPTEPPASTPTPTPTATATHTPVASTATPTASPTALPQETPTAAAGAPARPLISAGGGTILTAAGEPLRGENPRMDGQGRFQNSFFQTLRTDYGLNTVRILVYREPQNYPNGCGTNCTGTVRSRQDFATDEEYRSTILNAHAIMLDEWVERAAWNGFYVIIDYHPVGGRDQVDAEAWWRFFAPRYADQTHVIYELTNEPGGMGQPLANYMQNLYNIVRPMAPDTPIILFSLENYRGTNPANLLAALPSMNVDWNNAAVGIHMYWSYDMADVLALHQRYPMLNTEIGGFSEREYMEVIDDLEPRGISWISLDGFTLDRIPVSSVYWD